MFLNNLFRISYIKVATLLIRIKWSSWNPWAIGAYNMAWSKYIQTPMYEGRTELNRHFAIKQSNYKGDFAFEAFVSNGEFAFFYNKRTWIDRIRLAVAPFSFGDKFRIPWWRIYWWFYGVEEGTTGH